MRPIIVREFKGDRMVEVGRRYPIPARSIKGTAADKRRVEDCRNLYCCSPREFSGRDLYSPGASIRRKIKRTFLRSI